MNERLTSLRRVLFLKTLPDTVLLSIAEAGGERCLQKGELLFAEHERCIGLHVVLRGAIRVYKLDGRGRELTLDLEGPGESVVELPLFDGGNYPASAEAAEEETIVFTVPRERFRQLMQEHPQIAEQSLRALSVRMRRLMEMLEAQALHTVQARLADYLLSVQSMGEGLAAFTLPETNEAIASRLGTVREVVSRTLRSLQEVGAIDLRGRQVTVRDRASLCRIAGNLDR